MNMRIKSDEKGLVKI